MEVTEKIAALFEEIKKGHDTAREEFFETFWLNLTRLAHRQDAMSLLNQIYDWSKLHSKTRPEFFALINMTIGAINFLGDKFDDAMKYSNAAYQLFANLNDEDGMAVCSINIGFVHRSLGEIDLALKYGLPGLQQITETGKYKMFQIIACYWIGGVYAETGQLDEAIRLFQQGLKVDYAPGVERMDARLTNGIAGVYMRQKKFSLALENYLKALDLCDTSEPTFKARGLSDLGDYYYKMGDLEKAIRYNEESLAIRQEGRIQNGSITNLMNLGEIYNRQGKFKEAINVFERALKIAEEIKVKAKMYQIHRALSDIYLGTGNMPASMAHFRAFHEIQADVNHEDMEKKVKKQQQLFRAEQTEKENAIIKAQKAEIEHKNHQLQDTIEELTITKVSKQAKAITLVIAVTLIVVETIINHFVVSPYAHNNFFIVLASEGAIVVLLKPIENVVEHYLLAQVIKRKRAKVAVEN